MNTSISFQIMCFPNGSFHFILTGICTFVIFKVFPENIIYQYLFPYSRIDPFLVIFYESFRTLNFVFDNNIVGEIVILTSHA